MYAMTGNLTARPGRREELAAILMRASKIVAGMKGCHAYIVLEDVNDEAAVWIFEIWDDKEAHDVSLRDGTVRALIAEAMPILDGVPGGSALQVIGGHGLNM